MSQPRRLVEMSRQRCIELLEASHVGRVAWQSSDGQQILPVSYAYHEGTVMFRTSPFGVLAELIHAHDAALEVDELDQNERLGWSIVVQGQAQAVEEPRNLVQFWTVDGVAPWAAGIRNLFIQITPRRIRTSAPARSAMSNESVRDTTGNDSVHQTERWCPHSVACLEPADHESPTEATQLVLADHPPRPAATPGKEPPAN
ncbi:hypothetical protein GCM10022204_09600 [Microlunatus aurantiacus]|uniref:Pyridoxamine 5'-phosphate oxidase family protein n=1 Tax=Microlunatus aurantiacus TaxID=446786 RepID=A0ABP7CSV1_9ACTN